MKNSIFFSLFLCFTISLFMACSDNPVDNPGPPPRVVTADTVTLFTCDSVWTFASSHGSRPEDSVIYSYPTNNIDTLRVEYTLTGYQTWRYDFYNSIINSIDTNLKYFHGYAYAINDTTTFDSSFSASVPVSTIGNPGFIAKFWAKIRIPESEYRSFAIRNIRLWYIKRTITP